jgi:hypothetical protein
LGDTGPVIEERGLEIASTLASGARRQRCYFLARSRRSIHSPEQEKGRVRFAETRPS